MADSTHSVGSISTKNFIATAKNHETGKVSHRVMVHAPESLAKDKEKFQLNVKAILSTLDKTPQLNKALSITFLNDDTYFFDHEKINKTISLEGQSQGALDIDLQAFKAIPLKAPPLGFKGHLNKLLALWPAKTPVISVLWNHIIAPLVAFFQKNAENSQLEKKNLKDLKRLEAIYAPKDFNGLLSALKQGVNLQKRKETAEPETELEKTLREQTQECFKIGKNVAKSITQKKPVAPIAQECARNLIERVKNPNAMGSLLTIPSGYHCNGQFHSMLLSFYVNQKKELCLEKFTNDPEARENAHGAKLYYTLGEDLSALSDPKACEQLQQNIANLLETLWKYQTTPDLSKTYLNSKELNHVKVLKEYLPDGEKHASKPPKSEGKKTIGNLIDSLIIGAGGVLNVEGEKTTGTPKTDPWSLLTHWMIKDFPEAPLADKMALALNVTAYQIETVLLNLNKMSPETKQFVLPNIQARLEKLKRIMNKRFGEETANQQLLNSDPAFKELNVKIKELEAALQAQGLAKVESNKRSLKKDFAAAPAKKMNVALTKEDPLLKINEGAKTVSTKSVIHEKQAEIQALKTAILNHDAKAAHAIFGALTKEMDRLTELGDYRQTVALGAVLLGALPVPSHSAAENLWDKIPKEDLDQWSKNIAAATQYLWEAQLRLREAHIWPNQRVDLFNGRVILFKLARRKSLEAKLLIEEKLKAMDPIKRDSLILSAGLKSVGKIDQNALDKWTTSGFEKFQGLGKLCKDLEIPMDDAINMAFDGFTADFKQVKDSILTERYLPSADEEQDLKLRSIQAYMESVVGDSKYLDTSFRFDTQQTGKMDVVNYLYCINSFKKGYGLEIPNLIDGMSNGININTLVAFFPSISREKLTGAFTDLPSSIIDLRRHTMMTQCLMHPEYSLYLSFPPSIFGKLDGAAWYQEKMKTAGDFSKNPKELFKKIRDLQQMELLQRLNKMGRLELSTGEYVLVKEETIKVVPKGESKDSEAIEGLVYRPLGLGIPGFPNLCNYQNHQSVVGKVPNDLTSRMIGPEPKSASHIAVEVNKECSLGYGHDDFGIKNPYKQLTEVDALLDSLECEDRNPMDHYFLTTLHVNSPQAEQYLWENSSFKKTKGQTLSFTFSSPIEVMDFICQKPDLLEDEEVQKVLEMALFHPYAIQRQMRRNPNFFMMRGGDFKNCISTAIQNNKTKTAAFLMHIGNRIVQNAQLAIQLSDELTETNPYYKLFLKDHDGASELIKKKVDVTPLKAIISNFAEYKTSYSLKNNGSVEKTGTGFDLLAISASDSGNNQKFLFTYLLDWLQGHFKGSDNKFAAIPANMLGKILYGYALLKNVGTDTGLPFLQKSLIHWMEYEFIPGLESYLEALPQEQKNIVLNAFYSLSDTQKILEGNWKKSSPFVYENGAISINLITGLIKDASGELKLKGPTAPLPEEVTGHSDYLKLFGNEKIHAHCVPGNTPQEFTYYCEMENGRYIRFESNRDVGTLVISQWLPKEISGSDKSEWYYAAQLKADKAVNAEKILLKQGLWKSKSNPEAAFLILNKPSKWTSRDIYKARLNGDGQIIEVHTLKDAETGTIQKVCQDSQGNYTKWLRCVNDGNILFLRDPESNTPTEIKILDKNLSLKKKPDGSWGIQNGKYKGFTWFNETYEAGIQKPNETAKAFAASIGTSLNEFMLPIVNGKEIKFLMWPHPVKETHDGLEFIKGDSLEDEQKKPLLEVTISVDGKILSTCGGFLYLASFFLSKGDAKRAYHYLEMAAEQKVSPEELIAFDSIVSSIQSQKPKTLRQTAFKLKAELAIAKIRRQQLQETAYDPGSPEKFMEEVSSLSALYADYSQRLAMMQKTNPKALVEEQLELTPDEQQEFETIRLEAMQFLVNSPSLAAKISAPGKLSIPMVNGLNEAPPDFLKHLLVLMDNPETSPPEDLAKIGYLTKDNILKHFLGYCRLICEKKLKPKDLPGLLTAVVDTSYDLPEDQQTVKQSLEFARRMLLTVAEIGNPNMFTKENLAASYKVKKSLPVDFPKQGSWSLTKKIHGFFYMWDFMGVNQAITNLSSILSPIAAAGSVSLPTAPQKLSASVSDSKPATTLNELKSEISKDSCPLSPEEKVMIGQLIKTIESEKPAQAGKSLSLENLLLLFANNGYNMVETRRLEALVDSIAAREAKLKADKIEQEKAFKDYGLVSLNSIKDGFEIIHGLFDKPSLKAEDKWDDLKKNVASYFCNAKNAMEQEENDLLVKGCELAAQNLKSQAAAQRTLPPEKCQELDAAIKKRIHNLSLIKIDRQKEIIQWAATKAAPYLLQKMSKDKDMHGDAAIIEKAIDLYQKGKLVSTGVESSDIAGKVTQYLLDVTELQQLQKAHEKLPDLQDLSLKLKGKSAGDPIINEYETLVNMVYKLVKEGCNQKRYLEQDGSLKNQAFSRKYLVAEYRRGVILSDKQTYIIEKLVEDPTRLAQLRMGLGKTSFILPLVMQLLAEKGMLPIALVTEELFKMHSESMDQTTRELFRQAGMQFDFDINAPASPAYLAELYDRLLRVKEEQGYAITTVERLAAVENKLTRIADTLGELSKELSVNPNDQEKKMQALILHKQKTWLIRIKNLLDGDEENLGFQTQYLADEGDDIFDIRREINNALKGVRQPNPVVTDICHHLMQALMGPVKSPVLAELKNAIVENKQAALSKKFLDAAMEHLAVMVLEKPLSTAIGLDALTGIDQSEWVKYVTGDSKEDLKGLPNGTDELSTNLRNKVSAIKRILSSTFTHILQKNLDIDLGVRKSDGCVVAPRQNKEEKINTQFGDEYELILSHYIHYAARGPSDKFLEYVWRKLSGTDPERYHQILSAAKGDVLGYLRKPEAWEHRLAILENFVIGGSYLKLYKEQITLNVHDVIRGRRCGIATGTLNPAALPDGFNDDLCGDGSREVEAETYLKLAMSDPGQGLNQKVTIVKDNQLKVKMAEAVKDLGIKSILTQGAALDDASSLEIVKALRDAQKARIESAKKSGQKTDEVLRQYIFIKPGQGERGMYMWNPGDDKPVPFNPKLVDPSICFYYFDPADTRGTHFDIPAGRNVLIPGPTTQQSELAQTVWRLRKLGTEQTVEVWLLESVAERIKQKRGIDSFEEIKLGHVINDIKQKTLEERAPLNYKAALQRVRGITFTKMRKIAFEDCKWKHNKNYWDTSSQTYFEQMKSDIAVESILFSISRNLMVHSKEIDFEQGLIPTSQVSSIEQIRKAYETEVAKLDVMNAQLQMIAKNPLFTSNPHTNLRLKDAQKGINKAIDALEEHLKKFEEKIAKHQKNLPETVASSASANQNTLEQVQQQQLQQQSVKKVAGESTHKGHSHVYKEPDFEDLFYQATPKNLKNIYKIEKGMHFESCGLENEGIYVTKEIEALYDKLPVINGEPLARLAIIKPPHEQDYRVCIIGKNDYHTVFNKNLINVKKGSHPGSVASVYSLDTTSKIHADKSVGLHFVESAGENPNFENPALIRKCAITRLLMGCINFTYDEKEALKTWVQGLNEVQFQNLVKKVRDKGTHQQASFIKSLRA